MKLDGKTALITGGGSGIGLCVARLFLKEGAKVAICGRDADKLRRAADELRSGEPLITHAADLSDPAAARQMIDTITSRLGRIDVLVNNAGLNIKERAIRELTPASWQLLLHANLDSAFYCIHAVLPQMLQRRDGVIVNVSSIAGKRAGPLGGAGYAAAKFGLGALATCLAAEEKDTGIRISTICPGEVNTPILDHRPLAVTDAQRQKMLQPEDVAQAVLFVATLPPHVSIPEMIITPTSAVYI
jgi:NADP-dependent 3-hydroxy acid dehydrogenase YdfG